MQSTLAFTNASLNDTSSAGYRLRRAREELQLSLRDVASALHLLVSHVRAIEADGCEQLAGDDEFLAYMHNYASLVGLDAQELIGSYHKQLVKPEEPIQPLPDENAPPKRQLFIVAAVCMTLCACLAIWLLKADSSAPITSVANVTVSAQHPTAGKRNAASVAKTNSVGSTGAGSTAQPVRPLDVAYDDQRARLQTAASEAQKPLRSSAWFAALPSDRYTLQLLSLSKKTSSEGFIRSRQLEGQAAYIAIRNNDRKTWYTVTYGLYDSFAAAERAIQSLPESLRTLAPRVRKTGRLQRLMLR